jgi:hypothetical protein
MNKVIQLGDEAKDEITGFQGIVTTFHEKLHGMDQVGIQPPCGADGKVPDAIAFDVSNVIVITKSKVSVTPLSDSDELEVSLGDTAIDPVNNLKGVITCRTTFINGCTQFTLVPSELKKDGERADVAYIPGPRLKLFTSGSVKNKTNESGKPKTGGPMTRLPTSKL